jgi:hypothetical protein
MSILDKDSAMEDHWSPLTEDVLYDHMKASLDRFNAVLLKKEIKETSMTKEDALKTMMLLSALESWAFSTKNLLPDYLHEELQTSMEVLGKIVLEKP